jgi:hypothetical protein
MNSFALALLLGGLRGPLVMFLWSSSESQKSENNLEDFDTKVEWIRLLQPEFDTVHIFQIWNKAYNISVKMTSKSNKYTTILDALEYAHRVDAERPNNINILSAIAGIYFDKLSSSAERVYYRQRVLQETLPHATHQRLRRDDPGWRRIELDPMLDEHGNILPQYLQPGRVRLGNPNSPLDYYDGSELQFLKPLEPFPYGVPAVALGYNYYKRAQLLQSEGKQRHAQLSDLVVDSRPALALKSWAENSLDDARFAELQAFGKTADPAAERQAIEMIDASFPVTQRIEDAAAANRAVYYYDRCNHVADDAEAAYIAHIANFKTNAGLYESHRDDVRGVKLMAMADGAFLRAVMSPADQRQQFVTAAIDAYKKAIAQNDLILLKYYCPPQAVEKIFPPGITRQNVSEKLPLDPAQLSPITSAMLRFIQETQIGAENMESVRDYLTYIQRAQARLAALQPRS